MLLSSLYNPSFSF